MASEKDLIRRGDVLKLLYRLKNDKELPKNYGTLLAIVDEVWDMPTVDAAPVVHGEWDRVGGDIHSSGYAVYCSACNKRHFVHHKFSLGALTCDELFKEPNYCPNCGAYMRGEET